MLLTYNNDNLVTINISLIAVNFQRKQYLQVFNMCTWIVNIYFCVLKQYNKVKACLRLLCFNNEYYLRHVIHILNMKPNPITKICFWKFLGISVTFGFTVIFLVSKSSSFQKKNLICVPQLIKLLVYSVKENLWKFGSATIIPLQLSLPSSLNILKVERQNIPAL